MQSIKIKSYCKINLSLKVLRKLNSGYHSISSLITFCNLHDTISISKINKTKDKISFSGKFKKGINQRSNTITKVFNLLRNNQLLKNKFFKINIKKNIPHSSGLGGGSSNAAYLLNCLNSKAKLKLSSKKINKIANKIGFDTPISLKKQNTFLTGKKNDIIRLKNSFKLNLIIVYPFLICSTRDIYKKNKVNNFSKPQAIPHTKSNKKLINYLKSAENDLEKTVIKIYPKVKEVIDYIKSQKGCYFSRITGSGSACIGIFSNKSNAIYAQRLIKLKYPNYWCVVSKTI